MKKIIYATDLSENSVAALHYATQLAQIMGDDLIALHVYPRNEGEKKNSDFFKHYQNELVDFCKLHLKDIFDGKMITPAVLWGSSVADEIQKFSKDLNVRMIVMGSCGASKLKDKFLGTTTGEMIGKSSVPILAVPPNFKFRQPHNILFTSTFEDEDLLHLKEVLPLAQSLKAEIEIIHISHKDEKKAIENLNVFEKKVRNEIEYDKITFKILYSSEIVDTLRKAIEDGQPDIVLMPERKNSNAFKKGLIKDRIKKMQSCSPSPLLTLPALI